MAFAGDLADEGIRAIAMSRFGYLRTPMPAWVREAVQRLVGSDFVFWRPLHVARDSAVSQHPAPAQLASIHVPTLNISAAIVKLLLPSKGP